jgi:hypothetical protein
MKFVQLFKERRNPKVVPVSKTELYVYVSVVGQMHWPTTFSSVAYYTVNDAHVVKTLFYLH